MLDRAGLEEEGVPSAMRVVCHMSRVVLLGGHIGLWTYSIILIGIFDYTDWRLAVDRYGVWYVGIKRCCPRARKGVVFSGHKHMGQRAPGGWTCGVESSLGGGLLISVVVSGRQ